MKPPDARETIADVDSHYVDMSPLVPRGPEEPLVAIPTPPGWTLVQVRDSTSVRGVLSTGKGIEDMGGPDEAMKVAHRGR